MLLDSAEITPLVFQTINLFHCVNGSGGGKKWTEVGMNVPPVCFIQSGRIHDTFLRGPLYIVCVLKGGRQMQKKLLRPLKHLFELGEGNVVWKLWGRKEGKTLKKTKSVRLDINTPLFFDVMAAATQLAMWYIMHKTRPLLPSPDDHIAHTCTHFAA